VIDHSSEISTAKPLRTVRAAAWGTRFVALLFCALLAAAPLLASSEKISQSLKTVDPSSTVNVLIHFKAQPTAEQHQKIQSLGGEFKGSPVNPDGTAAKTTESYAVPASALDEAAFGAPCS